MGYLNSSTIRIAIAALLVAGCSADGSAGSADDDAGLDAPGGDAGGDGTVHDAGKSDSGKDSGAPDAGNDASPSGDGDIDAADAASDAVLDAGVDALAEAGTTCSPVNATQSQSCGICGSETRVCLGTPPVWQAWGACTGEVANGCSPGSQTQEACGMCGMLTKVCQSDCTYAASACTGQPPNACQSGAVDFELGLSCSAGQGRSRTCMIDCTWGDYSATCQTPPHDLLIGTTVGAVVSISRQLGGTPTPRVDVGSCPTTISSITTSHDYVVVSNPTTKTATVSFWSRKTATGPDIDTVMAAYATPIPPATPTQQQACVGMVDDSCADTTNSTSCLLSWAGLMLGDAANVTIPPSGYVTIYTAPYFAATAGPYELAARTDTLQ